MSDLSAALKAFANAIGAENVFSSEQDKIDYSDHYSPDERKHMPGAAVAPANT